MRKHQFRAYHVFVLISLCACGGGGTNASFMPPSAAGAAQAAAPVQNAQLLTSLSWSDGQQIPAAFVDQAFGAGGPFYQQLPANPQLADNSANAISYYFAGNPQFSAGWIEGSRSQEQYDYSFPLYRASTSDPLVTIVCTGGASCVDGGAQIHMPASARQAGGTDHHLAVLESDGLEYDFWEVSSHPPYADASSISAAGEAHFTLSGAGGGTGYIAPGFVLGGATAGGNALSIGQVYTSELAAGVINHALSVTFPCGTNSWVYPASQISGVCGSGQGMPLGSRVWWQPSDTQTNALPIARDMKTVLIALHHYGGFYTDSFGGVTNGQGKGMGTRLENQEQYWSYGNGSDPALAYAQRASGWNHVTGDVDRYVLAADGARINPIGNLKVVAPCVTQGTC